MRKEGGAHIILFNSATVIDNSYQILAAALNIDLDLRGAGVETIFNHLLDGRIGSVDDLACGYSVANNFRKYIYLCHFLFNLVNEVAENHECLHGRHVVHVDLLEYAFNFTVALGLSGLNALHLCRHSAAAFDRF